MWCHFPIYDIVEDLYLGWSADSRPLFEGIKVSTRIGEYAYDMLDSDGDGLYDTIEVNGVRIQNGTIVYTDPYTVDTDGDGLSDFEEIGGLPSKLLVSIDDDEYVSTINFQKSDPNNPKSTGKRLKEGYMVVEDFNYWPYNKSTYEEIFVKDTYAIDCNGEKIYGRYNIYNSNPNELTANERKYIQGKAILLCTNLGVAALDARAFLWQYLFNHDTRKAYYCESFLRTNDDIRQAMIYEAWYLMGAVEDYLEDGETVMLAHTPKDENNGINLEVKNIQDLLAGELNDYYAINSAKVRSVVKATYDGTKYTMQFRFYIFDYYDWDENITTKIGTVSPYELYRLCRCGEARFYENWGIYETKFSWEPTENSRQAALIAEKVKLGEHVEK